MSTALRRVVTEESAIERIFLFKVRRNELSWISEG